MVTSCAQLSVAKRAFAILLFGLAAAPAWGQGQSITIGASPPAVNTEAFSTTAVVPLQKGQTLAANFVLGKGCTSTWTVRAFAFGSGDRAVKYPVIGIINCTKTPTDGFGVFASTTITKQALQTSEAQHSGGYLMQTKSPLGIGESVPTLLFMRKELYSIVSIQASERQKGAAGIEPRLTIFDERLEPNEQQLVIEAWRKSNETVENLLAVPGQLRVQ